MYDIHVGDKFCNIQGGTYVTVIEIDLDGRIKYEFDGSKAHRWADRDVFLTRYPVSA